MKMPHLKGDEIILSICRPNVRLICVLYFFGGDGIKVENYVYIHIYIYVSYVLYVFFGNFES